MEQCGVLLMFLMALQHLLTQHSSLAHWDEDTMVFHADLDEFMLLVNPEAGNLADLQLAGCFQNVTQALFHLDDVGAEECGTDSELDCFQAGSAIQKIGARLVFRCCMWFSNHEWHACSEAGCCATGSSLTQFHGLEHYKMTVEKSTSWPKAMVHPDKTYGHHAHDSLDLPGFEFSTIDPNSCARVIHLLNLFKKRWRGGSLYDKLKVPIPESSYWPLTQHAEFTTAEDK